MFGRTLEGTLGGGTFGGGEPPSGRGILLAKSGGGCNATLGAGAGAVKPGAGAGAGARAGDGTGAAGEPAASAGLPTLSSSFSDFDFGAGAPGRVEVCGAFVGAKSLGFGVGPFTCRQIPASRSQTSFAIVHLHVSLLPQPSSIGSPQLFPHVDGLHTHAFASHLTFLPPVQFP